MSGHKPWSELQDKMSPESQARAKAEAERLAALLAPAVPPDQAWQPIETAPKDDRPVLVACGDRVMRAWWSNGSEPDPAEHWDGYPARWESVGGFPIEPTHWMPLPSPPAGEAQEPT